MVLTQKNNWESILTKLEVDLPRGMLIAVVS